MHRPKKETAEEFVILETVKRLKIRNTLGLHARAAAKIVELSSQYDSQLFLKKGKKQVDGSNILSILTLACPKGTEMEARIVGNDADQFMADLQSLFEKKFGESR